MQRGAGRPNGAEYAGWFFMPNSPSFPLAFANTLFLGSAMPGGYRLAYRQFLLARG